MLAYYHDTDPYEAEWLRNMISARHITPGDGGAAAEIYVAR